MATTIARPKGKANQATTPWYSEDNDVPGYQNPAPAEDPETPAEEAPAADRAVQLFSWWIGPKSGRKFAVIDKLSKEVNFKTVTVGIKLLEVDDSNPFYRDIEEFWKLVDAGKLVELVHNALGTKKTVGDE